MRSIGADNPYQNRGPAWQTRILMKMSRALNSGQPHRHDRSRMIWSGIMSEFGHQSVEKLVNLLPASCGHAKQVHQNKARTGPRACGWAGPPSRGPAVPARSPATPARRRRGPRQHAGWRCAAELPPARSQPGLDALHADPRAWPRRLRLSYRAWRIRVDLVE